MSAITVQLPESLKTKIEELAARDGYSVSQFIASTAAEKVAVLITVDSLKKESADGRREHFERYLAAVPDAPVLATDRID